MIITTGSAELDRALLSIVSALIIAWVGRKVRPKADVRWFPLHVFTFDVPGNLQTQPFQVHTATLRIENWGRERAKNVQVMHNQAPQIYKIWPPLNYEESSNKEGIHIITVKNPAPFGAFSIELLSSTQPLPKFLRVRSDEGEAKEGRFTIQRFIPRWAQFAFLALAFVGVASLVYLALSIGSRFLPS